MKINTPVDPTKTSQDNAPEPPQSARESIRAAMDEVKEKADETSKPEQKATDDKVVDPKAEKKVDDPKLLEQKETSEKVEKPVVETSVEKKEEVKAEDKKEEPEKPKKAAPFGLPKGIRAKWETTDPEIQDYLAKTVKENHEVKSNQGRKAYLNDVDQVLTPYMPQLQKLGASPAQLVQRLLQYSDALSNEQLKYQAVAKLANDFGIDLSLFGKKQADQNQPADQNAGDYVEPSQLEQKVDMLINHFSQMQTTHRTDNDKAANETVNQWSGFDPTTNEYKAKPFFPHVRQMMAQIIQAQTVPLVNGKIDLDGVYEAACYAHPEVREYMLEEQARSEEAKKLEEQKKQAAAIAKAKNAGTSIKPAAPTLRLPSQAPQKTNHNTGQQLSVRDSLRAAIAEAREARV